MGYVRKLETLARAALPKRRITDRFSTVRKCCTVPHRNYLKLLKTAVRYGHTDCSKYLFTKITPLSPSLLRAASASTVKTVRLVVKRIGIGYFLQNSTEAMHTAVEYDNGPVVEFLEKIGCKFNDYAKCKIAKCGDFKRFKSLETVKDPIGLTREAASAGNLFTLNWMVESGLACMSTAVRAACIHGRLDVLKYAIGRGASVSLDDVEAAFINGNLDCLMVALDVFGKLPEDLKLNITAAVTRFGDVSALGHLARSGNLGENVAENACVADNADALSVIERFCERDVLDAVRLKAPGCLRYMLPKVTAVSSETSLRVLKFFLEEDELEAARAFATPKVTELAYLDGSLELVEFCVREVGLKLEARHFDHFVENDNVECVTYMLEKLRFRPQNMPQLMSRLLNGNSCRSLPLLLIYAAVSEKRRLVCEALELEHEFLDEHPPSLEDACYAASENLYEAVDYYVRRYEPDANGYQKILTAAVERDNCDIFNMVMDVVDPHLAAAECVRCLSMKCIGVMLYEHGSHLNDVIDRLPPGLAAAGKDARDVAMADDAAAARDYLNRGQAQDIVRECVARSSIRCIGVLISYGLHKSVITEIFESDNTQI